MDHACKHPRTARRLIHCGLSVWCGPTLSHAHPPAWHSASVSHSSVRNEAPPLSLLQASDK